MSQSDYNVDEPSIESIEDSDEDSNREDDELESVDSSEEDTAKEEELDVWNRMQNKAIEKHQQEWEVLFQRYKQNGESDEVAEAKSSNSLIPVYSKELREILFEELKWIHHLRRDPTYKKIMATKRNLMDVEDYGWEEATESAIHQRKFLLNKLFVKQYVPKQSLTSNERFHPYTRKFY